MGYYNMKAGDNEELAELRRGAHARFMEGRRAFAEANPGALNPWERAQLINGDATSRGLQAHELAMLDKQNAGALAVEQEKARGMIGQGSEAAKANAQGLVESERLRGDALRDVEETKGYYGLTAEEARIAGQKAIAETQGQAQRDVATIQGTWGVKQQEAANIGSRAQAEIAAQTAEANRQKDITVAQITAGGKQEHDVNTQIQKIATAGNLMPEDRENALKALYEQHKNNPEALKKILPFAQQYGLTMTSQGWAKKNAKTGQWELVD